MVAFLVKTELALCQVWESRIKVNSEWSSNIILNRKLKVSGLQHNLE